MSKFSERELEILLQPVLTKELIEELKNLYSVKDIPKEKNVKKLEVGTKVRCRISPSRFFTCGKIYIVKDSDLDIGRVWVLDDSNFVEMLDRGEWVLDKEDIPKPVEKERVKNDGWGDWG